MTSSDVDVDNELSNSREAKFLQARAARYATANAAKKSSTVSSTTKGDHLRRFWSKVRQEISSWREKLHQIQPKSRPLEEEKTNDSQQQSLSLSEQRIQLRHALAELQGELDALRKHCLASSASSTYSSSNNNTSNQYNKYYDDDENNNWEIPEEIPLTDLRLLHTEFSNCADELEQTRNALLPKAKFVFHRYRKALHVQQQNQQKQEHHHSLHDPKKKNASGNERVCAIPNSSGGHSTEKHPLEDLSHVLVQVTCEGQVFSQELQRDCDASSKYDQLLDISTKKEATVAGAHSLVIRNVKHSRIILQNTIQELHISHVTESTIYANAEAISGALHVTGCQRVRLVLQSYHQMRLHESNDLDIYIENATCISGGTIMEDSTNIVFHIILSADGATMNSNNNKVEENKAHEILDVKDFNWLRNGVPSPNFRVEVTQNHSDGGATTFETGTSTGKSSTEQETNNVSHNVAITIPEQTERRSEEKVRVDGNEDHSDDEDEL